MKDEDKFVIENITLEQKELADALNGADTNIISNFEEIHEKLNIKNGDLFQIKTRLSVKDKLRFLVSPDIVYKVENGNLIRTGSDDLLFHINRLGLAYITKEEFKKIFKKARV